MVTAKTASYLSTDLKMVEREMAAQNAVETTQKFQLLLLTISKVNKPRSRKHNIVQQQIRVLQQLPLLSNYI